jgi:DNA polymerase (family 10)
VKKHEIAAVLSDIGTLLELKGENPFKIRAYQSGARVVESLGEDELAARIAAGTLREIKGIGEALAEKITELDATGKLEFYEKLKASVPAGLRELMTIPGVGPKKVKALHDQLGVDSLAKLQQACAEGKVAALEGFGARTQEKILEGIRNREAYGRRHLWVEAFAVSLPILEGLRKLPQVRQAESCGSLRRRMETVGDLDFLVATDDPAPIAEWFGQAPGVKEVTAKGETKVSVRLENGLQADLRMVPPAQFVFALHHFTGSKDHNVQMRHRALQRGLSMSEWGLASAEGAGTVKAKVGLEETGPSAAAPSGKRKGGSAGKAKSEVGRVIPDAPPNPEFPSAEVGRAIPNAPSRYSAPLPVGSPPLAVQSEADLFRALGLQPIPPELREGLGEIEAAEQGKLPELVTEADIRGVFHNHTTASDGHNTLEEMTAAAQALGLEYLGIADHSKASFQARGLDEARLAAQVEAIRKLNASKQYRTWVFAGTECDILPDGRLDFAPDVLAALDYVVVSVHSVFRQSREDMTKRLIRAIESPHVTMVAHLTGRLLLEREGYDLDVEKVIDAAIANDVVIELNASAWRLDMDWRLWRAADARLLCSINPDSHRATTLADYYLGVGAARKGWLTKDRIVNTKPLSEMKQWLAARR